MRTGYIEFTCDYKLGSGVAAEFECRATADVTMGRPMRVNCWPPEPGESGEITDFDDVEVEVFSRPSTPDERRAGAGYFKKAWVKPDESLAHQIHAYLESGGEDDRFQDALAEALEDDAAARADYQNEQRRDRGGAA